MFPIQSTNRIGKPGAWIKNNNNNNTTTDGSRDMNAFHGENRETLKLLAR